MDKVMATEQPLTTGETADYCHVSQATIVNWIKEGKLPGYTTPGGHYRILRSDLVSFLEAYGMPIAPDLRRSTSPRLLFLTKNSPVQDLARCLDKNNEYEVYLTESEYAATAEAARLKPDAAVIDAKACADTLGLCRWFASGDLNTVVIVLDSQEPEATLRAAGADACVPLDALPDNGSEMLALIAATLKARPRMEGRVRR